jgi:ABC-type glutathione transport system ATPase component
MNQIMVSDRVAAPRPGEPILQVDGLVKHFPAEHGVLAGKAVVHAVDDVDLEIRPGEVLAVVGESGSGKSTLARCVLRLVDPTAGRIVFDGRDVTALKGRALAGFRQQVQPVFQDPFSSLDPRWRVGRSVGEALTAYSIGTRAERHERVLDLLDRVGLDPSFATRHPHELSGGQRQRVGVARALAADPPVLLMDEPFGALDPVTRRQLQDEFRRIQATLRKTVLLVTHDMAEAIALADRIGVLDRGRLAWCGPASAIFQSDDPRVRTLVEAVTVAPRPPIVERRA